MVAVNPLDSEASWKTVRSSTRSGRPASRTPKVSTYTARSPATTARAAPGTPLRANISCARS